MYFSKMKVIVLLSVLVCAWGLSPKDLNGNTRIVGGEDIDITAVPYQVSVLQYDTHVCGGSILNQNYILTAAHCIINPTLVSAYSIRAGSSIRDSGGIIRTLSDIYMHPNYGSLYNDYDIAIFRLASPLVYQTDIQPVKLVSPNTPIPAGTNALASGWGLTTERGNPSTQLQAVTLPVVDQASCSRVYFGSITERMLCAGYEEGGRDVCTMDSGGPLVAPEYGQIGIVSFGAGCAQPGFYGVYANVSFLQPWIESIIGQ